MSATRAVLVSVLLAGCRCEQPARDAGRAAPHRSRSSTASAAAPAPSALGSEAPQFALTDLLFGTDQGGGIFWLARADGGVAPGGARFWLMCDDDVFEVEATGVEATDPGDGEACPWKACPRLTVVKARSDHDCQERNVLAVPIGFSPPRPAKPHHERRSYNLRCTGCGLNDGEPAERDSPPSAVQRLVAAAAPDLARGAHGIWTLRFDALAPIHWVAGSTGRGPRTQMVWMVLAQLPGPSRTLLRHATPIPREETGRKRTHHMMQHTCGVPFYSVPRPALFFSNDAGLHVVSAEQLPSDSLRFVVWRLSSDALQQELVFPVELPDPKF